MDKELIENIKEAATLLVGSAGIGYVAKKALKQNLINDPSLSFMNFGKWVFVLTTAIFGRGYFVRQKIIPSYGLK